MYKSFKILLVCTFFLFVNKLSAQYNNEWIDFNKTYYKFKLATTGLYRINQTALPAALQNTPAEHFQLWRNGQQVRLFTSVATGSLGSSGFIEFWGEKNDGKPDRDLYTQANMQLNDRVSLQTDTAAYFLTVNTIAAQNLRFTDAVNNVGGNTLSPTPYFMHSLRRDYKNMRGLGEANIVGSEYLYSSSYEMGEMWASTEIKNNADSVIDFNNIYPYTSGPASSLKAALIGSAPNFRNVKVLLNNNTIIDTNYSPFQASIAGKYNNVATATLGNNVNIAIKNNSTNSTDRILCSYVEFTYPRTFNFGGQSNFEFTLPASANGHYLEISNAGTANILYDITHGLRYTADASTPNVLKFAIPASVTEQNTNYILVSNNTSNITTVSQFTQKTFTNFAQSALQGNYIIISHKELRTGADYVEQYRAYRASATGGSYNAKIYDIDELVDQFAFGIKKHPLSIKNFLRYAKNNFSTTPQFALLIGHGVTYNYYNESALSEQLNAIPTFGYPGSDVMLAAEAYTPIPMFPIGRISVIKPEELNDYFTKLKEYEAAQQSTSQTIAAKAWMKNVVHVAGGNDPSLGDRLENYFNHYKNLIQDTAFGGNVATFSKATSGPVTPITNAAMDQKWKDGFGLITFFGHSSSSSLDYNLDDPSIYNNAGKYPVFLVNGCSAGNFFTNDPGRLTLYPTLSEKYTLAKNRGTIGFIASTSLGLEYQLDLYTRGFYNSLIRTTYNQPLGLTIKDAIQHLLSASTSFYYRIHAEQTLLHGDPALKINAFAKPDFVVEPAQIKISPTFISIAENDFEVKAFIYNIGKAVSDSVTIRITRQYPNGTTEEVLSKKMKSVRYMDSVSVTLPILSERDKGENKITVTIDALQQYDEMSENNNVATANIFIYEDELKPVYPYNYSIINKSTSKLVASTANPFAPVRTYLMEMDTTELFNSPFKISKTISSVGGALEFDPAITYQSGTAYYWRVAPAVATGTPRWNNASFIYLSQTNALGYNQSHLYQHRKSESASLKMDDDRRWRFTDTAQYFYMINSVYGYSGTDDSHFSIFLSGEQISKSACIGNSIIFNVFDPVTLRPLFNQAVPSTTKSGIGGGFMGSAGVCDPSRQFNFEFYDTTLAWRNTARDFMDWVGDKYVVTARLVFDNSNGAQQYASGWAQDNGGANNLYLRLKQAGFAGIDDYNAPKCWMFIYKKNDNSFTPKYVVSQGLYDRIFLNADVNGLRSKGALTSPVYGPVSSWNKVQWNGTNIETSNNDEYNVSVIGVAQNGAETNLYTLNNTQQDFDISSVSASQYPFIKLQLYSKDTVNHTPYQLNYWRVIGTPLPDGVLAPNLNFSLKDSLDLNEPQKVIIPFKNISDIPLGTDSIGVTMILYDKNNNATNIQLPRLKKLNPGDTAVISHTIDTRDLEGLNNLYVEVNPNNLIPEEQRFNNLFYKNFYVKNDVYNPLIDVTFDGVHILNGDIVAAKPHILARIKDEARYMPIDDTSLVTVYLRYPDYTSKRIAFGGDSLKFNPAVAGQDNEATVDFIPQLGEDGEYELTISAKDKIGNNAGKVDYKVAFNVYNKPMISNMFNYPNPFTTSTAFVFTLTGTEIPQTLRIQILTVTGKIVREINKEELGNIHIGKNITDYKWDGTDQYGQKLANGVYLYRVITNLNGNKLDKFPTQDGSGSVDTDKYFNKGYGKMYLMR